MEIVRKAIYDDLIYVAQIHKQQFSNHYLGKFSVKLLLKFYECFFYDKDLIFIVYEKNSKVQGFIVGGDLKKINNASSSFIKNNIPMYALEILFNPNTWVKSVQKLFKIVAGNKPSEKSLDATMGYTLLSIAVSKEAQGTGAASKMIDHFDELMLPISNEYFLSVHDTNDRAMSFYQKKGFTLERQFDGEAQFIKKL